MRSFRYKILKTQGNALKLGKNATRESLEEGLTHNVREIRAQLDHITELRVTNMYNHHTKLAQSTGILTSSLVKAMAEQRQQEKHKQKVFDAMAEDELDACLIGHFHDISLERREKFREALDALTKKKGLLG